MNEEFNEETYQEAKRWRRNYALAFILSEAGIIGGTYGLGFFPYLDTKNNYRVNANIDVMKFGELLSSTEEDMGWQPELEATKEAIVKGAWTKNENGEYQREVIYYDLSDTSEAMIENLRFKEDLDIFEFTTDTEFKSSLNASDIDDLNVIEIRKYSQDLNDNEYDYQTRLGRVFMKLGIVVMAGITLPGVIKYNNIVRKRKKK